MKTPKLTDLVYAKVRGGKKPVWQAYHGGYLGITGAGNSADNAGKDWQKIFRSRYRKV